MLNPAEVRVDADGKMLRPNRSDHFVRLMAAEMALPQVKAWLGPQESTTDEQLAEDIAKHIGKSDGYEIARSLEKSGWSPDSALVEILNNDYIDSALTKAEQDWVKCLGITLDLSVGTKVTYLGKQGVISEVHPEVAKYSVHTPDLPPTSSYICTLEALKTENEEHEDAQ